MPAELLLFLQSSPSRLLSLSTVDMVIIVLYFVTVLGIGFYSLHGSIQVEATELSVSARGAATSLHSSFFFLGHASGPVLYGLAFAQLGGGPAVALGGLVILLVGLMCARYLGRPRPPRS